MKIGFLAPITLCASLTCQAGDYFFEPLINASQRYNSNIYMRQKPLRGNWISTLSPSANAGFRHENGELKSNFTWNEIIYDNQPELTIAEQLFSAAYKHRYERFELDLTGSYNHQSSISTDTTIDGLQFIQLMRKQLSLSPSVTYSFNEKSALTTNYSYSSTSYEKNSNNIYYSDYDYHQASGTFNHMYTVRDKLNATLSSSLYKTKLQTTNNNVAQLGWQHSFSEQLVTYISGGMNYSNVDTESQVAQRRFLGTINGIPVFEDSAGNFHTQQSFNTVSTKKTSFGQVYSASIQKSFERASVSLAGSQNQSPTAIGLQTQTQLNINTSYNLSDRWTSGISANYIKSEITGTSNSPFNRTNYSISPNINWKCTPEINLGFSYTYRQQEYQSSTQPSLGNIAELHFSYQPQINHQVK